MRTDYIIISIEIFSTSSTLVPYSLRIVVELYFYSC
nr:MAG TPA: hypothetical protein [Caudoviricetes sp.]